MIRYGRRARGLALALCAFTTFAGTPASAQLAVDRVDLTLVPRSAGQQSAVITVTNTSDRPVAATVYGADWDRDDTGANRFYELGTLPRSCGATIGVFPRTVSLPPHSTQALQVMAQGADTVATTCWSIIFIETRLPPPAGESRQLSYVIRTGVKVYLVPAGLEGDGLVEDMLVHSAPEPIAVPASMPASPVTSRLEVVFRNSGATPLLARGSVEVRRPDNSLAATLPIEEFPTLPGVRRRLLLDLPVLPAGRYIALALIDFGGAEIVAGQRELEVP